MVGGSLLGGGCTAGSPPVALEQARTAYAQAQQTPQIATSFQSIKINVFQNILDMD
jgi:hypothetical protein